MAAISWSTTYPSQAEGSGGAPASKRRTISAIFAKFLTMLGEYAEARPMFMRIIEIGGNERIVSEAKKQLSYL